ncbi:hypothetical protein JIN77_07160 [Verrucomicrobiaceae bacterium R5-34]|nr:hypothetical protein [Verrucomicrobiaceae bacterium R5-34]
MKTILITILAACSVLITACDKKAPTAKMVATKVAYSHPEALSGGHELVIRQELGAIGNKTPSTGQPMTLTDKSVVSFSQSTDATDPSKIRVTVESKMDGFPPETQVLLFGSSSPYPPAAKFKNGLTAAVTVNIYNK